MRAAIVGAGMAGLACAERLREGGAGVTLYDKGRTAGGRVATRRRDGLVFNHGAQYATARTDAFSRVLHRLAEQGAAQVWDIAGGRDQRWTGTPGMSAIPRALPSGELSAGRQVTFLHAGPDGWRVRHDAADSVRPGAVRDADGALDGPFDAVLLALPAPQAAPLLLAAGHAFASEAARAVIDPCWSVMVATEGRIDAPDTERLADGGPLAWLARENSRPGRMPGAECWMLHATPAWSIAHLEDNPDHVAGSLLAAFTARLGRAFSATHLSAHRWRYSQTREPLGRPCLWDASAGVGVCGDWLLGNRVEDAFSSGRALAEAVSG